MRGDGRLTAVRIDCDAGSCTPSDPEWPLARRLALSAASMHLSIVRHFGWIHLAAGGPLAVVTRNELPPDHPLRRLLWPHVYATQYSNDLITVDQLVPGGDFDGMFSLTHGGVTSLIDASVDRFDLGVIDPDVDARSRGLRDLTLPSVDNRRQLHAVFLAHARRYLERYYDDDRIAADAAVQAWWAALTRRVPGVEGVAGPGVSVDGVARLTAAVIQLGAVEHEIAGSGMWDYQLWSDALPARVPADGTRPPLDVYQRLVDANFNLNVHRTALLSDFSDLSLDPGGAEVFRTFRTDLLGAADRARRQPGGAVAHGAEAPEGEHQRLIHLGIMAAAARRPNRDGRSALAAVPRGESRHQVSSVTTDMTISALSPTEEAGGRPQRESGESQHAGFRYVPALDGVRAFAVAGVLAYHGGVSWLPGGYLGVDAFFVLSGFLITSLLLSEVQRSGRIRLGDFWARRARRLLPALFLLVVTVVLVTKLMLPAGSYPSLRGDVFSTAFYVANWHFIAQGANYFAATGPPSPLTHTWSLAVEEQFYLVWPILVVGVLAVFRRIGAVFWLALLGALASTTEMAVLFTHGANETRLYYGTDTRAQSILLGAALAAALAWCGQRGMLERLGVRQRLAFLLLGVAGFTLDAVLWTHLRGTQIFLYEGGFLVAALGDSSGTAVGLRRPRHDPRTVPGVVAAGLAGAHQLRRLSLALPDIPVGRYRPDGSRGRRALRPARGDHVGGGDGLVLPGRAPGAARRPHARPGRPAGDARRCGYGRHRRGARHRGGVEFGRPRRSPCRRARCRRGSRRAQ